MSVEQIIALIGAIAVAGTMVGGLVKVIVDAIVALRKKDSTEHPPPEVGITAIAPDIDIRAYDDMRADRDYWRNRAEESERQMLDHYRDHDGQD